MATTCVVQFENNPSKVIYSGQLLRAVVNLTLTKPTTVHGIYVKLTGNAYAHWRGRRGSHRRGRRSFTRSEKYLDEQFYLLGGTSGNQIYMKDLIIFQLHLLLIFLKVKLHCSRALINIHFKVN